MEGTQTAVGPMPRPKGRGENLSKVQRIHTHLTSLSCDAGFVAAQRIVQPTPIGARNPSKCTASPPPPRLPIDRRQPRCQPPSAGQPLCCQQALHTHSMLSCQSLAAGEAGLAALRRLPPAGSRTRHVRRWAERES